MKQSRHATPIRKRRRQAQHWGRRAEWLCRWWLRFKGYRIVATNWRCPYGEIDIIARRNSLLVFVEVKARQDTETAAIAVTARTQKRITDAAAIFLTTHQRFRTLDTRFDVMMVTPGRFPSHCPDAWRVHS